MEYKKANVERSKTKKASSNLSKSVAGRDQSAHNLEALHNASRVYQSRPQKLQIDSSLARRSSTSSDGATMLTKYAKATSLEALSDNDIPNSSQFNAQQSSRDLGDDDLDDLMMRLSDNELNQLRGNNDRSGLLTPVKSIGQKRPAPELHRGPAKRPEITDISSSPSVNSQIHDDNLNTQNTMVLIRRNGLSCSLSSPSNSSLDPSSKSRNPLFLISPTPSISHLARNRNSHEATAPSSTITDDLPVSGFPFFEQLLSPIKESSRHTPGNYVLKKANLSMESGKAGSAKEAQSEQVGLFDDIEAWMAEMVDIVD